ERNLDRHRHACGSRTRQAAFRKLRSQVASKSRSRRNAARKPPVEVGTRKKFWRKIGADAWRFGRMNEAAADWRQSRHDIGVKAVRVGAHGLRNQTIWIGHEEMDVGEKGHRPRAVMRGDSAVERRGEMGDPLRFADPADPGNIEVRDADRATDEQLAIPLGRAEVLAARDLRVDPITIASDVVEVLHPYWLFMPIDVVVLERVSDPQ